MLNLRFMALAALAVIGVLFSGEVNVVVGQACQGDMQGLIRQCARYVQRGTPLMTEPSQGCCIAIRTLDIPCACQYVSKVVEQLVDMNKVVQLVNYCGIPVPPGMKCGSKIPN